MQFQAADNVHLLISLSFASPLSSEWHSERTNSWIKIEGAGCQNTIAPVGDFQHG